MLWSVIRRRCRRAVPLQVDAGRERGREESLQTIIVISCSKGAGKWGGLPKSGQVIARRLRAATKTIPYPQPSILPPPNLLPLPSMVEVDTSSNASNVVPSPNSAASSASIEVAHIRRERREGSQDDHDLLPSEVDAYPSLTLYYGGGTNECLAHRC